MHGAERIYEEVFGVFRTAPPDLVEKERQYLRERAERESEPDPDLRDLIESAWQDATKTIDTRRHERRSPIRFAYGGPGTN